jgi:AraC family transcriptional regulator of adaptative response/methylated-DNA-[protein]-cysteine methyltransferase
MAALADAIAMTDERRWRALVDRDDRADGSFVYAVKTTGVYCRPGCRSRLPKQRNVVFFGNCDEAERAGYRACKKCRPRAVCRVPEAIIRACRAIEAAAEPLSLADLAEAAELSPFHFHRQFKEYIGVTPKAYAVAERARRFRNGLLEAATVTEAVLEAGFVSNSRCYANLDDDLGMTPTQFRRAGAGLVIRHAVVPCALGWMLVAATERGLCRIEFGDDSAALAAGLKERFPKADLRGGDAAFSSWVEGVLELVDAPAKRRDLPLDIQGTAFQRQVWQALRAIPPGATATYSDIAVRIGRPTAARAVAQACGSNPVAVLIPCHRVIGSDGELRGYRWGIERKRQLLERETDANHLT